MPKFKSIKSALNYFEKSKAASMKDVAKCIEDIMKEEIQEQVYDAYKPQGDYVRTGEFIDSVKATDITEDRLCRCKSDDKVCREYKHRTCNHPSGCFTNLVYKATE